MSFVLDNSVIMRWFFGDGKPYELAYAGKVLDAMKKASARVPATWGLEVANVIARAATRRIHRSPCAGHRSRTRRLPRRVPPISI